MGRSIIRLDDAGTAYYLEWSSVVDAPVTYGMTLDEFREYYRDRYGSEGMKHLPSQLDAADATSTSSPRHASAADLIRGNRAGEDESELTREEIVRVYIRERLDEAASA